MPNFAIVENDIVTNVIVCESLADAQSVVDKEIIPVMDENPIGINWSRINNVWVSPQPYPSWTLENNEWISPIPYPEDGEIYEWDEKSISWVLLSFPS